MSEKRCKPSVVNPPEGLHLDTLSDPYGTKNKVKNLGGVLGGYVSLTLILKRGQVRAPSLFDTYATLTLYG